MQFQETDHFVSIDTASVVAVGVYLSERLLEIFPNAKKEADALGLACNTLQKLYDGQFARFQAADTPYHNLEHTLQVSVCLMRMIQGAFLKGECVIKLQDVMDVLLASFCHDIGYFKERGDEKGTGAKYAAYHEARGALLASEYLTDQGLPWPRVQVIQRYILSTGTHRALRYIGFKSSTEALLARMLVTADILAQMSDPNYLDRLPFLFLEFQESDDYLNIPIHQRRYPDLESLQSATPSFWEHIHRDCLKVDCDSVYDCLNRPMPSGENFYLQSVAKWYQDAAG